MRGSRILLLIIVLLGLAALGWAINARLDEELAEQPDRGADTRTVPVEVATVKRERIDDVRNFTGTLEASQDFVVASKVSGRIERVAVNLADNVERGQVVVNLDNDEYVQALAQAEADLAVARANQSAAESQLRIAEREFGRIESLRERGVSTESDMDSARANQLNRSAAVEVARAQVTRARSAVETARIRLAYSQVTANWRGGSDTRTVAERFVEEGDSVSVNDPLLRIVDLEQMIAVFFVTERDYGLLAVDQEVELGTDAYPDSTYQGRVVRIAPVFRESTRQARIELLVPNPLKQLKPGMFMRARVILRSANDAVVVPESALVTRQGEQGVFLVNRDTEVVTVGWAPVEPGIRQGQRVELRSSKLEGEVVILGQQLLKDGAEVTIPDNRVQ